MVDISEGIQFRRDGIDPSQWPKLSCNAANQLTLEFSHLNLDSDRSLSFRSNGKLQATGDLQILTGNPATEQLTILANGNVGVGTQIPTTKLEVKGMIKADSFQGDGSTLEGIVKKAGDTIAGTLTVNSTLTVAGNVNIGAPTLPATLDVTGTIRGKGILAGIWAAQPLTDAKIVSSGWSWQNIPDTSVNFNLDRDAIIFCTYSINVQPDGNTQGEWLSTRVVMDGTPYQASGAHNQPYTAADSNVNLNGNLVVSLKAGNHSASLQWMKPYNNVPSWSNCPSSWGDGFIAGRTLVVMAFYQ